MGGGAVTPTRPRSFLLGKIGPRARKDFGDLDELAANILTVGQLQPVAIKPDGTLIDGHRRLRALDLLYPDEPDRPVPVHILETTTSIGEYFANVCRKDFTLSERVALWREVEPLLKEAAKQRQREHGGTAPGQSSQASGAGRLRDQMKKITGMGGRTLEKAIAIVEAAEVDPAKYGPLVPEMDRTGADGAYKKLRRMQSEEQGEPDNPSFATLAQMRMTTSAQHLFEEGVSEGLPEKESARAVMLGCVRASASMCFDNGIPPEEFRDFMERMMEAFRAAAAEARESRMREAAP